MGALAVMRLVAPTGDDLGPAFMMMTAAAVSTIALLFVSEAFHQRFQATAEPVPTWCREIGYRRARSPLQASVDIA